MKGNRCEQCENILVNEINGPRDFILRANSLVGMLIAGDVEMTYSTCPLGNLVDEDMRFSMVRYFHQFRCTKCGTIYGMFFDTRFGGETRINDEVFDPSNYPDKKEEETDG